MILITHDLGVVSEVAKRVSVMYAGKIVEEIDVAELFENPLHPYTQGLLKSLPSRDTKGKKLFTIGGSVPKLSELPKGCRFNPRCPQVFDTCRVREPDMIETSKSKNTSHKVRCFLYD